VSQPEGTRRVSDPERMRQYAIVLSSGVYTRRVAEALMAGSSRQEAEGLGFEEAKRAWTWVMRSAGLLVPLDEIATPPTE
jgi:hypothetical protein